MQPQRSLVEDRVSRQGAGEASSAWVQCFTDQRSPRVLQCPRRPRGRARHGRPESLRLEGYSRQVPPGRGPSRITRRRTSPSLCVPTRSVGCRLGGDDRSRRHPGRPILRMPAGPCAALGRVCLDITERNRRIRRRNAGAADDGIGLECTFCSSVARRVAIPPWTWRTE